MTVPDPGAVAARFGLGTGARFSGDVDRGEQGQVRRLVTDQGSFAVKESFGPVDPDAAQATAAFQSRCHAAGVPCPLPVPGPEGRFLVEVDGLPLRVQSWVDVADPDPVLDPAAVGSAVATLHRVVLPTRAAADSWHTDPVGAREWQALVKAARGAGAPFADRLAALVPSLVEAERLVTPMTTSQWCHQDLFADNVRAGPDGPCIVDFDNAGPGDPTRELALVVFEFARGDEVRLRSLVAAYEAAGGTGRIRVPADFGQTIAQLHHIGRHQVLGWLRARDPEARARAHAGVREFVDEPFLVADVERLVGWLDAARH